MTRHIGRLSAAQPETTFGSKNLCWPIPIILVSVCSKLFHDHHSWSKHIAATAQNRIFWSSIPLSVSGVSILYRPYLPVARATTPCDNYNLHIFKQFLCNKNTVIHHQVLVSCNLAKVETSTLSICKGRSLFWSMQCTPISGRLFDL